MVLDPETLRRAKAAAAARRPVPAAKPKTAARPVATQARTATAAARKAAPVAQPKPAALPEDPGEFVVDWERMQEDFDRLGGSTEYYKLQPGSNNVRFLMNPDGYAFYGAALRVFVPSFDGQSKGQFFVSPKTAGKDEYCPFMALVQKLKAVAASTTDPLIKKNAEGWARELTPQETWASNVLVKQTTGAWRPFLMQFSRSVFKGIVTQMRNLIEDTDITDGMLNEDGNIAHPQKGVIVVIDRQGQALNTTYAVTVTGKKLPVTAEQLADRVDISERCKPDEVGDIELALCDLFGVVGFDELIDPETEIPIPDVSFRDNQSRGPRPAPAGTAAAVRRAAPQAASRAAAPAPAAQRRAAPKPLPVEEEEEQEEQADDGIVPTCIGLFGAPEEGFDCATCPYAVECEQVQQA